jgi:molybdopterin-containing oxidoreductase family membrane subunit
VTDPGETSARLDRLGVGRFSWRWAAWLVALLVGVGVGGFAYAHELRDGLVVSGLRTIGLGGAVWGLYIACYVYFVGLSFAGISTAALARLFALRDLEPVARIAELLAIVSLLVGSVCIVVDLGRPFQGLLYLPLYARPSSPFFGTFTLVLAGYLFASLVYFFLAGRADAAACAERFPRFRLAYALWAAGWRGTEAERARRSRSSFWLSLCILPLLVAAHSTLGLVFGIQGGRPGWFSALQAPSFVVLAGSSGTAMLIVVAAAFRRLMGLDELIPVRTFRLLGNLLWTLTLAYLYLMAMEEITATYAAAEADARVAHEVVFGAYAGAYLATVACFAVGTAIPFVHFVRGRTHVGWLVFAAVLVNAGSLVKRLLITVPSQTHGTLLPYPTGTYVPSLGEVGVMLGLCAAGGLVFLVFPRLFPILSVVSEELEEEGAPVAGKAGFLRAAIFWTTLASGLALAVVGFALSLRIGTLPHLDPVVPASPLLFAVGVMLTFYSAAAYETLPPARDGSRRMRRQ